MKPKSHTLFHFTKNKDILKQILKDGFWPRFCPEDIKWLSYDGFDFVAYPMVCFCDIPLSRIDEHVGFYGNYGVGLTKEWVENNSGTPVQYISGSNHLIETFKTLSGYSEHLEEDHKDEFYKNIRYVLAHTKPTQGNMVINGEVVEKEFYQESEWRCVPKHGEIRDHLTRDEFDNTSALEENNHLTLEYCKLRFTPSDIKYIFVKNDSDIPSIINFIQTELDNFPSADLKILMSRVISLENIKRDM